MAGVAGVAGVAGPSPGCGVACVSGVACGAGVTGRLSRPTASPRTCVARWAIAAATLALATSDGCSFGPATLGVCAVASAGMSNAGITQPIRFNRPPSSRCETVHISRLATSTRRGRDPPPATVANSTGCAAPRTAQPQTTVGRTPLVRRARPTWNPSGCCTLSHTTTDDGGVPARSAPPCPGG